MEIIFKTINWYYCEIYKKRKFLGKKLIGIAMLDINDELTLYLNDSNKETYQEASIIALKAKQYILWSREYE
ncbi:MAG: hypothetical protein J6D03_01625 [Clostridia bacterium]|nr:hypothetical protein [Clostridia bacterium]